jgi:hypothetical protein
MSTQTSVITPLYDSNLGFNDPSATTTTISIPPDSQSIVGGYFNNDNMFNVFRRTVTQIISMKSNDNFSTYYLQQILQAPIDSSTSDSIVSNDEFTVLINRRDKDIIIYQKDIYDHLSTYQTLKAPTSASTDLYGLCGIYNDFFVVTDRSVDNTQGGHGALYVYKKNSITNLFAFHQTIETALTDTNTFQKASMHETTFIVGLPTVDIQNTNNGAAFVYEYNSTNDLWEFKQQLLASRTSINLSFGRSVCIYDNYISIGSDQQYFYIFKKTAGVWAETQELQGSLGVSTISVVCINKNVLGFLVTDDGLPALGYVDLYHLNTATGLWVLDTTYTNANFTPPDILHFGHFAMAGSNVIGTLLRGIVDDMVVFKYDQFAGAWSFNVERVDVKNTYKAFRDTKNFLVNSQDTLKGFYNIVFELKATLIKDNNINEANNKIYFYENGEYKYATITIQNYANISTVITAVQTAMNTASGGYNTYTITYDSTWREILVTAINPFTFMPDPTNDLWYQDSLIDKVFGISNTQTLAKSIKSYRPVFLQSDISKIGLSIAEGFSSEYSRECNLQKEIQSIGELNSAGTYYITPTTRNYQINFKEDTDTFNISFVDSITRTEFDVKTFNWRIMLTKEA